MPPTSPALPAALASRRGRYYNRPVYLTLLFWLALLPPGYVVVRAFCREDLESGPLGGAALSYAAVLALLSPVSILCYVLRLPVAVMSFACVAAFLAGIAIITRRRWWREIVKLLAAGICVELAIVAADLALGHGLGPSCAATPRSTWLASGSCSRTASAMTIPASLRRTSFRSITPICCTASTPPARN